MVHLLKYYFGNHIITNRNSSPDDDVERDRMQNAMAQLSELQSTFSGTNETEPTLYKSDENFYEHIYGRLFSTSEVSASSLPEAQKNIQPKDISNTSMPSPTLEESEKWRTIVLQKLQTFYPQAFE